MATNRSKATGHAVVDNRFSLCQTTADGADLVAAVGIATTTPLRCRACVRTYRLTHAELDGPDTGRDGGLHDAVRDVVGHRLVVVGRHDHVRVVPELSQRVHQPCSRCRRCE